MISGEQEGWREDGLAMKRRGGGTKHTHTHISCTCPDTVFLLHQRHMHTRDTLYCTPTHTSIPTAEHMDFHKRGTHKQGERESVNSREEKGEKV